MEVVAIHGMGISVNFDLARVEPAEIVEFARRKLGTKPPADALFVSCTNYRAFSALPMLRELYDIPVITSNQAALQAACRALSVKPTPILLTGESGL
jgi:maleate isomerase